MTERFPAERSPEEGAPDERVSASAGFARRGAEDLIRLLAGVVRRLGTPLAVAAGGAIAAVLALAGLSAALEPPDRQFGWILSGVGLIAPLWLLRRRQQLTAALQPTEAALADLRQLFDARELADQLRANLTSLSGRRIGPRTVARGLWREIRTGAGAYDRVTGSPRLAPFLPGRLRGLAVLTVVCVATAVAAGVLDVLLIVLLLAGLA